MKVKGRKGRGEKVNKVKNQNEEDKEEEEWKEEHEEKEGGEGDRESRREGGSIGQDYTVKKSGGMVVLEIVEGEVRTAFPQRIY